MQHGGSKFRHTQIVSKCEVLGCLFRASINGELVVGCGWWSMETQLGTNPMRQLSQSPCNLTLIPPSHLHSPSIKDGAQKRSMSIQGSAGQFVQITEDI